MSSTILDKSASSWEEAISYCEKELATITKRAEQLKAAISTFKANLKRKAPWPGNDSATQS